MSNDIAAKLELVDLDDFLRRLSAMGPRAEQAAVDGLQEVTEEIFRQSQAECVVRTGILRASAIIDKARRLPGGIQSAIRYTRTYAFRIHETPDGAFKTPRIHGKWKYLADPIARNQSNILATVGKKVKAAL